MPGKSLKNLKTSTEESLRIFHRQSMNFLPLIHGGGSNSGKQVKGIFFDNRDRKRDGPAVLQGMYRYVKKIQIYLAFIESFRRVYKGRNCLPSTSFLTAAIKASEVICSLNGLLGCDFFRIVTVSFFGAISSLPPRPLCPATLAQPPARLSGELSLYYC
jgi:hypothetical protein